MTTLPEIDEFLQSLEKTQHLPPERMAAYQRRLLGRLVAHAMQQTELYPARLQPLLGAGGAIAWERWQEIPVLTRAEAQDGFEALRARTMPPAAGHASEDTSSGSTGRPLRHLTAAIQDLASACASERFFRWHGMDPHALTVRIRAVKDPAAAWPAGRKLLGWRAGYAESAAVDLSIATPVEQQIEWILREKPRHLATYPSNLREIAREASRSETRLPLDAIMTFGEMMSDDMREAARNHFGLPPLDRYGSSEVGHISATCPHSLKQHVASELVLLELLDEGDQPVRPGEVGRVIVTPLYNLAMPLIRYELGDYAVLSPEPCGCGRTLPVLERIMGRTRNVFRFVDGSSKWPVLMSRELHAFVPNRQFQVVQHTHTEIELRYVPAVSSQPADLDGLTAYLREKLHPSVSIRLSPMASIARSHAGKFEDCMSLVA